MIINEEVFTEFISGKEKAFGDIFRQYYKSLVSFSVHHGLEQMEAEDLVIEVMHHIWEIRDRIKSASALHSLMYKSVHNRSMNVLRNINNRKRIIENYSEKQEIEEFLIEEEVGRILNEAIEKLPAQCQKVIKELLTGKSTNEIADKLDISPSSVKTYKQRSIEILKKNLKNYPLLFLFVLSVQRLK